MDLRHNIRHTYVQFVNNVRFIELFRCQDSMNELYYAS